MLQLSRKPEAFGRTVVEALSVGRPVLGWAHGGVGELLRAAAAAGRGRAVRRATRCTHGARDAARAAAGASGYDAVHLARDAGGHACGLCRTRRRPTDSPRRDAPPGWRWAPAWVLAFVALWPAPGYAEGVLVLGALAAIVKLLLARFRGGAAAAERPGVGADQRAVLRLLAAGSWCRRSMRSTARARCAKRAVDLRYLPFLWLVAAAVADARGRRITFGGLAIIVGVWTLDALLQALTGTSPLFFGIDAIKQAISGHGMCSAAEVALRRSPQRRARAVQPQARPGAGQPVAVRAVRRRQALRRGSAGAWPRRRSAWSMLLAGSRASWITYALVLLLSGWRLLGWKQLLGVFAFGAVALVVLALASPQVRERIERTTHVLAANESGVDTALSGRARIWGAALCMARTHPVNGVGARGFREAFAACDPAPGQRRGVGRRARRCTRTRSCWKSLSETGAFGLLLWLAGVALAWRAWRYADARRARTRAAGDAGAGGDGVPVQHPPGVLFDVLGRADPAAGGAVRRQPAGAAA